MADAELRIRVGSNIAALRKAHHLKQREFAEALGITPNYLSAVERGISGISMELLEKICTYFYVSADNLLFGFKYGITTDEKIEKLQEKIRFNNELIKSLIGTLTAEEALNRIVDAAR